MLKFAPALSRGTLLRRYKRFLADIETPDGSCLTVHCPNTGAMTGCAEPGFEAWYSQSSNPKRKYPHTLEVIVADTGRVGVNTARANALVKESLEARLLPPFAGFGLERAEAAIPDESGRFDFLLHSDSVEVAGRNAEPVDRAQVCYVEVKNMTLCDGAGRGSFPDAVSERAIRHVRALQRRVQAGQRGVLLFCVRHTGITRATLADEVHPAYGEAVRAAVADGVEVYAFGARIEVDEICISAELPVDLCDQRRLA